MKHVLQIPWIAALLVIREKTLGPRHPDYGRSLWEIARLHSNQEDYSRAAPLYERALTVLENAYGPSHPTVLKLVAHRKECLQNLNQPSVD